MKFDNKKNKRHNKVLQNFKILVQKEIKYNINKVDYKK